MPGVPETTKVIPGGFVTGVPEDPPAPPVPAVPALPEAPPAPAPAPALPAVLPPLPPVTPIPAEPETPDEPPPGDPLPEEPPVDVPAVGVEPPDVPPFSGFDSSSPLAGLSPAHAPRARASNAGAGARRRARPTPIREEKTMRNTPFRVGRKCKPHATRTPRCERVVEAFSGREPRTTWTRSLRVGGRPHRPETRPNARSERPGGLRSRTLGWRILPTSRVCSPSDSDGG
jgi:hypothetical protein